MTINEARFVFKKANPDREIVGIYDYNGDYMFIAKEKGTDLNDNFDPYFIVNSKDGSIMPFSPVLDLDWLPGKSKKYY